MTKKKEQLEQELVLAKFELDGFLKTVTNLHQLSQEVINDVSLIDEFEVRFSKLEVVYESFTKSHHNVVKLIVSIDAEANLSEQQNLVDQVNKQYYSICAMHRKINSNLNSNGPNENSNLLTSHAKLPKIQLPTFTGQLKEWPHFKDLFCSLVHDKESIPPIEKFQYLLSCLSNEAHNLARTLPVTAQNYTIIWNQLISRYDDKRRLATFYLEEILSFPCLNNDSPTKLRQLLDTCSENTIALKSCNFSVDLSDFMLLHSIVQKLDKKTRQIFESKHASTEFPTLENLLSFIRDHCKALDAAQNKDQCNPVPHVSKPILSVSKSHQQQFITNKPSSKPNTFVTNMPKQQCLCCGADHVIYRCPKFLDLPVTKRKEIIQSKQACFNCLHNNHMVGQCTSISVCKHCGKRHHSLLHLNVSQNLYQAHQVNLSLSSSEKPLPDPMPIVSSVGEKKTTQGTTVLLGTAAIQIQDFEGKYHTIRALLDAGSQASFITDSCASRLGLPRHKFTQPVLGLSQTFVNNTKGKVKCLIKPRFKNGPLLDINPIVLDKITSPLPAERLDSNIKKHFDRFELADPFFDICGNIDVLLGADLYPDIFDGGRQSTPQGMPTLYRTIFGWVLIGPTNVFSTNDLTLTTHLAISESNFLENCMKRFWEIEELPKQSKQLSPQEEYCEKLFSSSHQREPGGRYVVRLPFKNENISLGDSFIHAEKCLLQNERRFAKNPSLKTQYQDFMNEYEGLGHMKKVETNDMPPKYFIPHHAVFKDSLAGRKIRIVFNGSAKTSSGQSLNDQLLAGPKLQNDVSHILSRFRLDPVVFVTDICKMYRQILVHPTDQPYQAILWRKSPDLPISMYFLQTVTYGLTSSPYLAIRTLHQLASDEANNFPEAAKVLVRDTFVDDLLVSCDSIESAKILKEDLLKMLKLGGFELKKWASNHPELLQDIPEHNQEISFASNSHDPPAIKVLGIKWTPSNDCFSYNVSIVNQTSTKRSILSTIAQLFDPLGWVTPVIFWAKTLMQKLWILGISWDEKPPVEIVNQWKSFVFHLPSLETLNIPRFAIVPNVKSVQLHGFSDASLQGYAAVLFLRSEDNSGQVRVNMVIAKSRVAPVKPMTVPRLELCAAQLLAKLLASYKSAIDQKLSNLEMFAWSDSMVTLSWIHTPPYRLKTFVANRVSEIHDIIEPSCWKYTPSSTNPADCASRGLLPQEILNHKLWWHGPDWLHLDPNHWPIQPNSLLPQDEVPEVKSHVTHITHIEPKLDCNLIDLYSNLTHLKRVTAYVLRFILNCTLPIQDRRTGNLTTKELDDALLKLIKMTQNQYFSFELKQLKKNCSCTTAIQRLNPFLDDQGVIRVGGRIRNSLLNYDARHPVLLPKHGKLSELLVDYFHQTYLHVGPRGLQSLLQRKFWILSARNLIRKRIFKCLTCKRHNASTVTPFMADLPAVRTIPSRPFLKVGVDFGGPFLIKSDKLRKPQIRKAYLSLFICLSTKAIHLEVVSDMTVDAFLGALNRLIARRGLCSDIYSDQGSTFIGAHNEIEKLVNLINASNELQSHLCNKGVQWHFNPPYAPNFGGIWEAGIKSAKYHLKRVLGDQTLTFEELSTLFTQIEAILNSRPLCALSTDPNEIDVLTPGHFLVGEPLLCLPHPDLTHLPMNHLTRWQLIQQARQNFWKRWNVEYLHSLQQRDKWITKSPPVYCGDLVLIKDMNLPPQKWKIGRIVELFPGKDQQVRVVNIKTAKGIITRPVSKLCPLPFKD